MTSLSTTLNHIKAIAEESSKNRKKELLAEYKDIPHLVDMIAWLTNPLITSGIAKKKMDKTTKLWSDDIEVSEFVLELSPVEFLEWLQSNNTGSQTVLNTTYAWILNQKELDSDVDVDMLKQFVAKSFRIGMSAKSINAALEQIIVPEWQVQLAFPYADKLKAFKHTDIFTITQKLDGIRCVFVVSINPDGSENVQAFTRSGKEIVGLVDLVESVKSIFNSELKDLELFKEGVVLDGELLASNENNLSSADLFQYTSKLIRTSGEKRNIFYNMFDIVPLKEFEANNFTQPYSERRSILDSLIHKSELIIVVEKLGETTTDNISPWSALAAENEWEGVMLNHNDATYSKTRSKHLLKVKEMHTADLEVVGFKQSEEGAFKGSLGAIIVKLDEKNNVDVGSGFTKEQRDYIWNHQDEYLNKIVEIQYFEITTDRFGNKSMRFPVWLNRVRFDKTVDDTNID